jgi:hypothetical protein
MARAELQRRMQLPKPTYHLDSIIDPRQCHTTWNLARQSACMPVIFPGIPHPMGACECLETSRHGFSNGSTFELRLRSLVARKTWLRFERPSHCSIETLYMRLYGENI